MTAIVLGSGTYHTCAIVQGTQSINIVVCWGRNDFGQLGTGNTDASYSPTRIRLGKDGIHIL
jgi:alpha-tubulin suppressor-like RCC1 family protein